MSDIRDYLVTIDKDKAEATQIIRKTASSMLAFLNVQHDATDNLGKEIDTKQISLIDLVQSLREFINDDNPALRSKAVTYLALVTSSLPPVFLTRQQVQVLSQFFCDRIEDGGAVLGLHFLSSLPRFTKDMALQTFGAMLKHFRDLQLRPQPQRFQILTTLSNLIENHREPIKDLGRESLVGIADLTVGEKDPRNLMVVFSILQVVLVEWDIVGYEETLFESIFCYFPITFRPPPNDVYGITAQDLKTRLKECIAASPYFAPYAFPQLADKLDSSSVNVKKDVLQAIAACASAYGVSTMFDYSLMLWDVLKYEIFNAQEEELAQEALMALQAIASCLSRGSILESGEMQLEQYLSPILKECNARLQEPQHKQATAAADIIKSIAETSFPALTSAIQSVVPPLLNMYRDTNSIEKRRSILRPLSTLLESAGSVLSSMIVHDSSWANPLNPFKDLLFEKFGHALMGTAPEEVSFRILAGRCLLLLCLLPGLFETNEIGMIVQYFNEIVIEEGQCGRTELRKSALQSLLEISKKMPKTVMEITFPVLIARLPESGVQKDSYHHVLESLAYISYERELSDTLVRRLLNKIELVLHRDDSTEYAEAILATLHFVLSRRELFADPNLDIYFEKIVSLVFRTTDAIAQQKSEIVLVQVPVMVALGKLARLVVRVVKKDQQALIGQQIYSLFGEGPQFIHLHTEEIISDLRKRTIILSTYLLAAIKAEISLPYNESQLIVLVKSLVQLCLHEEDSFIRQNLLRHLALLINKFIAVRNLDQTMSILWRNGSGLLEGPNISRAELRVGFWLSKALIMRLFNVGELLSHLSLLLTDLVLGPVAAKGFELLLASDEIVSKENGARVRLLAKQKTLNICLPIVAKSVCDPNSATRANYLIALSGVLKHVDSDTLKQETETIVPLLLQSLDLDEQEVKAATIEALSMLLCDRPANIEEHTSSLINRLLGAATNPKVESAPVRYHALRCLSSFPGKINDSVLLPYRKAVIRGMRVVLDDPKRHVRKEGVDCNAAWLNLDEADEEV